MFRICRSRTKEIWAVWQGGRPIPFLSFLHIPILCVSIHSVFEDVALEYLHSFFQVSIRWSDQTHSSSPGPEDHSLYSLQSKSVLVKRWIWFTYNLLNILACVEDNQYGWWLFNAWASVWSGWKVIFDFRMGSVFSHLATHSPTNHDEDDTILVLLVAFWPLLEKLFGSAHMENGSLSAAACRSLSQAVHSSGTPAITNSPVLFVSCGKKKFEDLRIIFFQFLPVAGQNFLTLLPKSLDCLSANFLLFQNHDCYVRTGEVLSTFVFVFPFLFLC